MKRDRELAENIAKEAARRGGRVYYVGGYVRDKILKVSNKDIDIEIYGIPEEDVKELLASFGKVMEHKIPQSHERFGVKTSFGCFNIKGYGLDVSIPRTEISIGERHNDYKVITDPYLSTKEASKRRDFTMNALMEDVLTGKIIDEWDGMKDIKEKRIRHIDDKTFAEDSLRVFRAAQFSARYGFTIDASTCKLCQSVDTSVLSRERVYEELKKALVRGKMPSLFFRSLDQMGQREWFLDIFHLDDIPQNPKYHPEGSVYEHTMQVIDAAAEMRFKTENPEYYMMATLLHDIGKTTATKYDSDKGVFTAYGHETEGIPLAEDFLYRLNPDKYLKRYVCNMIENHMKLNQYAEAGSQDYKYNILFDKSVNPNDLLLLAKADAMGSGGIDHRFYETVTFPYLNIHYIKYQDLIKNNREVTGNDLFDMGIKQGIIYRRILNHTHKLFLKGFTREDALADALRLPDVMEATASIEALRENPPEPLCMQEENNDIELN